MTYDIPRQIGIYILTKQILIFDLLLVRRRRVPPCSHGQSNFASYKKSTGSPARA